MVMIMDKKIKVLIVDDSILVRQIYTELLSEEQDIEVVGQADSAEDARAKIKSLNPDVITLDIEMPGMNGLDFLEKIMTLRPMPVIMSSTLTQVGSEQTIKALEIGAVDFIGKPFAKEDPNTLRLVKNQLISKIKIAATAKVKAKENKVIATVQENLQFRKDALIAIGSSTGGVEANKVLLEKLPKNSPPIVITQHMPKGFTASFASRMSNTLGRQVYEAKDNQVIEWGCIYIAPGDIHMEIHKKTSSYIIKLNHGDLYSGHRPSVDVMFNSIAKFASKSITAVILTGMGKDGAEGLLEINKKGGFTIGQNEASCVVYGMPKAAKTIGAVNIELPLDKIADRIIKESLS